MEIKTNHRGSAEANRPKGRALLALAERREAPLAALFAALTVGMAAWVKSAFGGDAAQGDEAASVPSKAGEEAMASLTLTDGEVMAAAKAAPMTDDPAATPQTPEEAVADLGRIGRGPGAPDISRFFQLEEPALDLPAFAGPELGTGRMAAKLPEMARADAGPPAAGAGPVAGGKPVGGTEGAGNPGNGSGGSAGGGSSGGGSGAEPAEFDGIGFETLFARFAEVVRPFHPATVREIGHVAIGDWISAQELQRLRGSDSRPDAEAAFMARENQTAQLLSNAEGREAFLDRHFPSQGQGQDAAGDAMPFATLAETEPDGLSAVGVVPGAATGLL